LEKNGISTQGKKRLLSVLRMEQITKNFQYYIDRKGAVIFTLKDGSTIRDNGQGIIFTAQSPIAQQTALTYAQKKWGKKAFLEKNTITRAKSLNRGQSVTR
jgi:hypothetical protein